MGSVVEALDRENVRRRLRAARMLADFTAPAKLAEHPLCKANGITASLIIETERKTRDALPMELETIARACGLPADFFYVPFERMSDPAASERLAQLERRVEALQEEVHKALDEVAASRMKQAVRGVDPGSMKPAEESQPRPRAKDSRR